MDRDDLADVEATVAIIDAMLEPIATTRIDLGDPNLRATLERARPPLERVGATAEAHEALAALLRFYADGDDELRAAIRGMFERYRWFSWATGLPPGAGGLAEFRLRLLHLSARDQGADPRDLLLELRARCDQARATGLDIAATLREVAALSSDVDRYGMGSMRQFMLRCLDRPPRN